ncbi:hypothetical protein AVEN_15225-1 [Araneus ventricosus]|uniref:Uncharacterized protein n=1 Tax=Araneus ventricosus TaxID=182803 RepID=A0A4Y2RW09_ARAVE|nr:hypothetical protein AVEN_15225-1 [Araneus ventricosus]
MKNEISLPEDSERSSDNQIIDYLMRQNFEGKVKSDEVETPNNSALKGLIENLIKLAELAACVKIASARRNIHEVDLISGLISSLPVEFLPKLTSPAINQSLSRINEIAIKPKIIESAFNSGKHDGVEMEVQSGHKDAKELCLTAVNAGIKSRH